MFRRLHNSVPQSNPLAPEMMQTLNQANRMAASGQPGQAAQLFTQVADEMEATNHPRRAANLHAQAAHAFADSHNPQAALAQARLALNLFIQNKMVQRTPVFYANISRKLTNQGMPKAAAALAQEFGERVGPMPSPVPSAAGKRGSLPTNCSKCGAPIRADEVAWVDARTIECNYCGSLIREE
jgi:ATP/maltotriose-dependent transcriptional regulator MalT